MSDTASTTGSTTGAQRGHTFYLIAVLLAAVALGLGLWDLLVERDGGGSWVWSVVFPAALLVLTLSLYARRRRA